jgi:hypothetical protein
LTPEQRAKAQAFEQERTHGERTGFKFDHGGHQHRKM